ncbi:MAG: translocation/assembly module TamB domain-containing protein [Candidatus Competibacterales bacterium]|nr:translocation/assembly module TamB domain-containing protein [Candidatus Competibacterales bacterium]
MRGHLHVVELVLADADLRLPPGAQDEEPLDAGPPSLPEIRLPLSLALERIALERVRIHPDGGQPMVIDSLQLRARSLDDLVQVETLSLSLPQGSAQLSGTLTPTGSYPLYLDLEWELDTLPYGPLQGQARLTGALGERVRLQHQVEGFVTADLDAVARDLLRQPHWEATLSLDSADLGRFSPELAGSPLAATLQTQGGLDDYKLDGRVESRVPELGPVTGDLVATGSTRSLHLERLRLSAAQAPLALDIQADVDLDDQTLTARGEWRELAWPPTGPARFASPEGRFDLSGTLDDYRLQLGAQLAGEMLGRLQAKLEASGSLERARLQRLELREPDGDLALDLDAAVGFADLAFEARAEWRNLRWPLTAPVQILSPAGALRASGRPEDYQAQLTARLDGPQLIGLDARLDAAGSTDRARVETLRVTGREDDLRLEARGELALQTLDFQASGNWQALRWPLQGTPQYRSPQGEFSADGNLQDYSFLLRAAAGGATIPAGDWRLEGQGSAEALPRLEILGETLEGRLQGTVSARWLPRPEWQAELRGSDLNPGAHWNELPGKLGFVLRSQGRLEDQLEARVSLDELSGQLTGKALGGGLQASLSGASVVVERLSLQAGEARLSASGELAEDWNLDFQAAIPQLAGLVPGASGSVDTRGSLRGPRLQPRATLELDIVTLAMAGNRIGRLQGSARLDASGANPSQLEFRGRDLVLGGQEWRSLELSGAGTPASHTVRLDLAGAPGTFGLGLDGGLEGNRWRGRLSRLAARDTLAGDWQLSGPAGLQAGPEAARLEQACLESRPSRLCLGGNWSATGGGTLDLALERLDLARFATLLPENLDLEQSLSATLTGRLGPDGSPDGRLDLTLDSGRLTLSSDGRPVTLALGGGRLQGRLEGESAQGELQLDLGELGRIDGRFGATELRSQPRVDGQLQARLQAIDALSQLVPAIQQPEGRLDADLRLSGALPTPALQGAVQFEDGAVSLPELGTRIEAVNLSARGGEDGNLVFDGQARSGEGELNLGGSYQLGDQALTLNVQGEDFQVIDTFSQVIVSPDVQVTLDTGQVRVSGRVTVPVANLSPPPQAASRVTTSSDVVIVEPDESQESADTGGRAINAELRVVLGDAVWVEAAGFRGQLRGDLTVRQSPQLAPRGSGTVEVVAGDYTIYGQDLAIERGRLLFSGGPVDNPGLDLRVARTFENDTVRVGAQISGTLREPRLELFSTPAMANSSIISYLVFGRAPGSDPGENQLLAQAATALGARGGNFLTEGLGEDLGVDLRFDTNGGLDDSSLLIGKYLTPELYVSYGIGLFDAVNTFSLSYELTRHLRFESSTSAESNSADLLYTIER